MAKEQVRVTSSYTHNTLSLASLAIRRPTHRANLPTSTPSKLYFNYVGSSTLNASLHEQNHLSASVATPRLSIVRLGPELESACARKHVSRNMDHVSIFSSLRQGMYRMTSSQNRI